MPRTTRIGVTRWHQQVVVDIEVRARDDRLAWAPAMVTPHDHVAI